MRKAGSTSLRRGAVLLMALVLSFIAMVIIGAMCSYFVQTGRLARLYYDQSVAMIEGAQKSIDQYVITAMRESLELFNRGGSDNLNRSLQQTLKEYMSGKTVTMGGYRVELKVSGLEPGKFSNTAGGTIEITAVVRDKKGNEITTVRQSVMITTVGKSVPVAGSYSHPVFNYAYFAENSGYIDGKDGSACSWFVMNGDVGANKTLTMNGVTVNGYVKTGLGTMLPSSGAKARIWPKVDYDTHAINHAAPCAGKPTDRVRPTTPYSAKGITDAEFEDGYEPPQEDATIRKGALGWELTPTVKTESDTVIRSLLDEAPLPKFDDTSTYINYCKEKKGTVRAQNTASTGIRYVCYYGKYVLALVYTGRWSEDPFRLFPRFYSYAPSNLKKAVYRKRLSVPQNENDWYVLQAREETYRPVNAVNIQNGYWDGKPINPSYGRPYFHERAEALEKGSIILYGVNQPIEIDGPVYVAGDVVIRGKVKGQGAIYAGRNIYILGDVTYVNPPKWPHRSTDEMPSDNSTKDLLGLYARGSIIIGNYTTAEWQNYNLQYLTNCVAKGSFKGDYTAKDTRQKVTVDYPNWDQVLSGKASFVEVPTAVHWLIGREDLYNYEVKWQASGSFGTKVNGRLEFKWTKVHPCAAEADCMFYESVFGSQAIDDLSDTTGVRKIDAVLCAGNGIFGTIGDRGDAAINGGMSCRDDGLLPCFKKYWADHNVWNGFFWINWDPRINETNSVGKTAELPTKTQFKINVSGWQAN